MRRLAVLRVVEWHEYVETGTRLAATWERHKADALKPGAPCCEGWIETCDDLIQRGQRSAEKHRRAITRAERILRGEPAFVWPVKLVCAVPTKCGWPAEECSECEAEARRNEVSPYRTAEPRVERRSWRCRLGWHRFENAHWCAEEHCDVCSCYRVLTIVFNVVLGGGLGIVLVAVVSLCS